MKIDLAVIGQGAVTPAGLGLEPLLHGKAVPQKSSGLRCPGREWPVLRVDRAPLSRWEREPRLRRSSPITLFLIEAAEQALAGLSAADRAETGLIVAFSAGCLVYSRRFFEDILKEGQKRASPALFPETVFNSPGSHVAATLKLNSAAHALVGDESAWIAALKMAAVWLEMERVRHVLVLGAEEFDPLVIDAYESARWLRRGPGSILPSEGAAGLLVRRAVPGDSLVISEAQDGFGYRTKRAANTAAENLFCELPADVPAYRTARGTWLESLENKVTAGRPVIDEVVSDMGHAFTASAAWNTIRALAHISENRSALALPVWGLNHQLGFLRLERKK
jgi:hypothetical protein